jgi:hypothetical protein
MSETTRASTLKVLNVKVRDGIITEVEVKWDSRPKDTEWVLIERVSKISQGRPTRSGGIPAVTAIPASTEGPPETKRKAIKPDAAPNSRKRRLPVSPSSNNNAAATTSSAELTSIEDEDVDETSPNVYGWGSTIDSYVAANEKEVVSNAWVTLKMILTRAESGKYKEKNKKINVFSLAGGKGSEIEALLKQGIDPSKIRCFLSELMTEDVVMALRMNLVKRGVEHYWLGPLGDPEMFTRINIYKTKFGPADFCFASPPCQDFSLAGNQRGVEGENGQIFSKAVEVIRYLGDQENPRFVWMIENTPMKPVTLEELNEMCGVAAFKSNAREVWTSCSRVRLIWTNFLPGPLTKNPNGDLEKILVNRSANAIIGAGRRTEGESYCNTIKASGHDNIVVEGERAEKRSKLKLLELEHLLSCSSTESGYQASIDCSSGELVPAKGPDGKVLPKITFTDEQRTKIIGNSVHVEWIRQLMR